MDERWAGLGSFLASAMFLWAVISQYFPDFFSSYTAKHTNKLISFFSPYVHVTIPEYTEYTEGLMLRSEAYSAVEAYLTASCTQSANNLTAVVGKATSNLLLSMGVNEEVVGVVEPHLRGSMRERWREADGGDRGERMRWRSSWSVEESSWSVEEKPGGSTSEERARWRRNRGLWSFGPTCWSKSDPRSDLVPVRPRSSSSPSDLGLFRPSCFPAQSEMPVAGFGRQKLLRGDIFSGSQPTCSSRALSLMRRFHTAELPGKNL